jgi:drug/metabolite transporter superfamily protein YnfA
MKATIVPLLLLLAACLEVGGDAIVRVGLRNHVGSTQLALIALGGLVLLAYGVFVNIAPVDFGRLLGVTLSCLSSSRSS